MSIPYAHVMKLEVGLTVPPPVTTATTPRRSNIRVALTSFRIASAMSVRAGIEVSVKQRDAESVEAVVGRHHVPALDIYTFVIARRRV